MAAPRTKKPVGGSATPNPVHKPLDALDRDILTELVRDGRIPNNVLAERLGPLQYAGCTLVIAAIVTNVILEQTRRSVVPA